MMEVCGTCRFNWHSPDGDSEKNGKFCHRNEDSCEYEYPIFKGDACEDWEETRYGRMGNNQ